MARIIIWGAVAVACLLLALMIIPARRSGPPDEVGLRRAEVWLRDVRDISARDDRWDYIRWYSYSKIGHAYVVFEGGVQDEAALFDFRRAVEQSDPPVPLSWHVRVMTNVWSQSR